MGVIGALAAIRPMMTVWAFSIPMPMFMAALIWIAIDITGIFIPSNVANIAHLSGIFFGLVLGLGFRIKKERSRNPKVRINEEHMKSWEDKWMRK